MGEYAQGDLRGGEKASANSYIEHARYYLKAKYIPGICIIYIYIFVYIYLLCPVLCSGGLGVIKLNGIRNPALAGVSVGSRDGRQRGN